MLNEIIKIDLHIHSISSKYKDGAILENSTIDNLDTLISKLNENEINLCAITDHNKFNYELYKALRDKISNSDGSIKYNLPGVEFDVVLETGKPRCHVVAIFDDSNEELLKKLENNMFDVRELKNKEDAYTLKEFDDVLKSIGLSVILIVHQRQGIDNSRGDTQSLSGAIANPYQFLQIGYIDCLEYNKPRVEGIVRNSLRDAGLSYPLITGSDCHEWEAYPYHDLSTSKVPRDFTKLKCLPSFKGLLMSITSFKTRSNRVKNDNLNYLKGFYLNDEFYPLANGINAIIGDNGAGKSLLTHVLSNIPCAYYKKIVEQNKIKRVTTDLVPTIQSVEQGQIVKEVRNGNLFEKNEYFNEITTKESFALKIRDYFNKLLEYILLEIDNKKCYDSLSSSNLKIVPIEKNFHWPVIKSEISDFDDIDIDNKRMEQLEKIISSLEDEINLNQDYYNSLKLTDSLKKSYEDLKKVYEKIESEYNRKKLNNTVRSIIQKKLLEYKSEVEAKSNSNDNEKRNILDKRDKFKNIIVDAIKRSLKDNKYPVFPSKMSGASCKQFKGYNFNKIALYNDRYLKEEFFQFCFNEKYSTDEKIKSINSEEELDNALSGYKYSQLLDYRKNKIEKFIDNYCKETTEISEISTNTGKGNTPGEISLVYYKFTIEESNNEFDVLIIDQPEDDINPLRIRKYLNTYLSSLKDKKQVIIVTHNPLLVVNLDVDNVIYVNKTNNLLNVKYGALEYENKDEKYSMLNLVMDNLDGGYDAVERRLKAYGKDNN